MDSSDAMAMLSEQLKALITQKKELAAETKEINSKIGTIENQLSDLMVAKDMQNFTHNGSTFYLTTELRVSVPEDKGEELLKVLRENDCGELITETVNGQTLKSFVKSQMEDNNNHLPKWLIGVVNTYEQSTVGVRKASAKGKH